MYCQQYFLPDISWSRCFHYRLWNCWCNTLYVDFSQLFDAVPHDSQATRLWLHSMTKKWLYCWLKNVFTNIHQLEGDTEKDLLISVLNSEHFNICVYNLEEEIEGMLMTFANDIKFGRIATNKIQNPLDKLGCGLKLTTVQLLQSSSLRKKKWNT